MSPTDKSDGSTRGEPAAPEDIRAELERILTSRSFESAGRSSEFLRFVVEQHIAGASDRLKGYTIAIEVFRRPPEFDAQSDPLVRVEAGRLRRRLLEYYAAEGHGNPLRIELPRGGYAPQFRRATPLESTGMLTPAAPRRARRWRRRLRAVAGTTLIVLLAALLVMQYRNREPVAAATADTLALPTGPKILVLPFENLSGDSKIDYVADGVTEEIMLRLSDFHLFVIASQTSWSYRGADRAPAAIGEELGARYVLTGTVRNTADRVRISARLVHAASGAQLWTAAYDEDSSAATLVDIQEKIAREVVETVAVPYGPIYEQELARATRKPAKHLDTYDCMLKYYAYRKTIDPALHEQTLGCFQIAVAREPNFADAWAGLALLYLDQYAYGYPPQSAAAVSTLDRAREAARKALDIDGNNSLANLALARVRFFGGDLEGFARSADRLLELSPNNAEVLSMLGALFEISGATARAQPLIDKAIVLAPHPPSLYHVAESIANLRAGRADDALEAALKIDAPNWFIAPLLVAVSAGLAGRTDVAQRAAARLLELYPTFPQRFGAEVAKWQVDAALGEPMLRGLLAAGVSLDVQTAH